MSWNDFNDAEQQPSFELIPRGTVVRVRMTLKPGGYDDPAQGWMDGYATQSRETGSVYLAGEFVVLDGTFAKRKLWSNIGLYSPKGPTWGQMGRSFIRAVLNSAKGIQPQDNSPNAAAARRIAGFHDLDGIEFVVKIDIDKDTQGEHRNVIRNVIEPDHKEYVRVMNGSPLPSSTVTPLRAASTTSYVPQPTASATSARATVPGKPSWAQ